VSSADPSLSDSGVMDAGEVQKRTMGTRKGTSIAVDGNVMLDEWTRRWNVAVIAS